MKNSCLLFIAARKIIFALVPLLVFIQIAAYAQPVAIEKVRTDFKALLQRPAVNAHPVFTVTNTNTVVIEKGYLYTEASQKVPVLIYKPLNSTQKKLPVVICLHGTGGSKDNTEIKNLLSRFCEAGFMAVAIDGRYHGERADASAGHNSYNEAIIRAWQNKNSAAQEHPFYFDTVYDLWKLVDYLVTRTDVDSSRIGMMGISKGGIETWMAASVDTRIKVAVPVIAVQGFKWSLENNRWQGRARTIWPAHVQAAKDLGDTGVNKHNVEIFWNKLLPGITGEFDCPSMIRLFAPRPLLILNTENDPNCPLPGAKLAYEAAVGAYQSANATNKLQMDIEPNEPHRFTAKHQDMAVAWFIKWL